MRKLQSLQFLLSRKYFLIAIIIISIFCFAYRAFVMLDPDFGWHYKMGEYILSNGIPMTDPFSYTMPSFPFIDHAWGTNIFIYAVYNHGGWSVLALFYTILTFSCFWISFQITKGRPFLRLSRNSFLFLLVTGATLPYFAIRPQVISWLFLSILLFVLLKQNVWNKWKFALPFLFLVWGNIHGSFGAGISILVLFLLSKVVRTRKVIISDIIVAICCFTITLINPYGLDSLKDVMLYATDISIHWTIQEWMPAFLTFNGSFLLLLSVSLLLIWKYRKQFLLEEKVVYIITLLEALSATRHVPLWVICAIPFTISGLDFLYKEVRNIPFGFDRLKSVYQGAIVLSSFIFIFQSWSALSGGASLSESQFYPKKAVSFLVQNEVTGRVFSDYGWGGYLDWKLPKQKLFIDGRMDTWKWDANPSSEEAYAFNTYRKVLSGETPFLPIFEKYNVQIVLLPVSKDPRPIDTYLLRLEHSIVKPKDDEEFNFFTELEKSGWKKIYEDDISVIYHRET